MPNARQREVDRLIKHTAPYSISILMTTHEAWNERSQDPIRLRNLLQEARRELLKLGLSEDVAKGKLAHSERLIDDTDFWLSSEGTIAAYVDESQMTVEKCPVSLIDELVVVGERFHLKPFLSRMTSSARVYILGLSQNKVRLYEADMRGAAEIPLGDVGRADEETVEQHLSFHTGSPSSVAGKRRAAVFHGHGGGSDTARKTRLVEFCKSLDKTVVARIDNGVPLFLAGHDPLPGIYRSASLCQSVQPELLPGTLVDLEPDELHVKATSILTKMDREERARDMDEYKQQCGSDLASNELARVLTASHFGRIKTVFVASDIEEWGRFVPEDESVNRHVTRQNGDEDLLNLAALNALRNGGKAYVMPKEEMPGESPIAAIFRFPRTG